MLPDLLQIRGGSPDGPNPGKVGEGIAQNINGPDPKGAASKVCCTITAMLSRFTCVPEVSHSPAVHAVRECIMGSSDLQVFPTACCKL